MREKSIQGRIVIWGHCDPEKPAASSGPPARDRGNHAFEGRDRRRAAATAPSEGLTLCAIRYPAAFELPGAAEVEGPARSAMIATRC